METKKAIKEREKQIKLELLNDANFMIEMFMRVKSLLPKDLVMKSFMGVQQCRTALKDIKDDYRIDLYKLKYGIFDVHYGRKSGEKLKYINNDVLVLLKMYRKDYKMENDIKREEEKERRKLERKKAKEQREKKRRRAIK